MPRRNKRVNRKKWSYGRVFYYSNSTATFCVLLQCGDVNPNPGPEASRPSRRDRKLLPDVRCSQCEKLVAKNHKRCVCTTCFEFTHVECTQVINLMHVSSTTPKQWICRICIGSVLHYYAHISVSDDQCLISTSSEIINDDIHLQVLSGNER